MQSKTVCGFLWLSSLFVSCLPAQEPQQGATDNTDKDPWHITKRIPKGFGFEVQLGSYFGNLPEPSRFTNIPIDLRTVPTHPDDGYPPGTTRTIPTTSFTIGDPKLASHSFLGLAPQYTLWRFTARAGIKVTLSQDISSPLGSDAIPEINQFGTSERGYGTSLVYYRLHWDPKIPNPAKPFAEVELRVHRFLSVIGGYGGYQSQANVIFENGWDRYDALQTYSTRTFASITQKSGVYYGALFIPLGGPFFGCRIGYTPMTSEISYLYPGVNPNFPGRKVSRANEIFWAIDFRLTQNTLPKKK